MSSWRRLHGTVIALGLTASLISCAGETTPVGPDSKALDVVANAEQNCGTTLTFEQCEKIYLAIPFIECPAYAALAIDRMIQGTIEIGTMYIDDDYIAVGELSGDRIWFRSAESFNGLTLRGLAYVLVHELHHNLGESSEAPAIAMGHECVPPNPS